MKQLAFILGLLGALTLALTAEVNAMQRTQGRFHQKLLPRGIVFVDGHAELP